MVDCTIINNLLNQKGRRALYNVPIARFTITSPYPTFTKTQLDMRRKVEILKYANQNSQSNGTSKSQRWVNIVSGKGARRNISQSTANTSANLVCASDEYIPTLTTACDVPGPPIYLTYDPTVPLYNYIIDTTYAMQNKTNPAIWNIYTTNELTIYQDGEGAISTSLSNRALQQINELGSLIINDTIPSPTTTFTFTIPIGIWCTGVYINSDPPINIPEIDISINSIDLIVNYNGVRQLTQPVYNSNNPGLYGLSNLTVNPNLTNSQMFFAIQYVGMITIPNLTLATQPGSIYNLQLSIQYGYRDITSNANNQPADIQGFKAGIFCNLSQANQNISENPSITDITNFVVSRPSTVPYSTGSFVQYNNISRGV